MHSKGKVMLRESSITLWHKFSFCLPSLFSSSQIKSSWLVAQWVTQCFLLWYPRACYSLGEKKKKDVRNRSNPFTQPKHQCTNVQTRLAMYLEMQANISNILICRVFWKSLPSLIQSKKKNSIPTKTNKQKSSLEQTKPA